MTALRASRLTLPCRKCTRSWGWDLYLPADLVQELDRLGAHGFEFEEAERYFRVRFLGRDKEPREESEGSSA